MAVTDILVLLCLVSFAADGAYHGFLRSLVKPLSSAVSILSAWMWFLYSHDFNSSCVISLGGPFLLSWLMDQGIKHCFGAEAFPEIPAISRLGGSIVGLAWGSLLALLAVAFLAILPFEKFELQNMGKDVHRSHAVALVKPLLISKGILPAAKVRTPCLNDVCKMDDDDKKSLADDKELQDFQNDPHIQKLLADPDAMAAIKSQNIGRIMSNPAINSLKSDPDFIRKAMLLYPKIQQKINAHENN